MSSPLASGTATHSLPTSQEPAKQSPLARIGCFLTARRVPITIVMGLALFGVDLFLRPLRPRNLLDVADLPAMAGLVLVVLGLFVRSWAAGTLHKMKTLTVTGPYSLMRNPLYFGSFLMMVGFCTILWDLLTFALLMTPMIVIYLLAVRREEKVLANKFPDAWPAYRARTPRFLPYNPFLAVLEGWSLSQWLKNREYQAILGSLGCFAFLTGWHLWPK